MTARTLSMPGPWLVGKGLELVEQEQREMKQKVAVSDVTDEVQRFYDRYPYPRPIDSLEHYRQLWQDPQRRRADHHLFWPASPYREDHEILVAGCGTSQAAKHALRWPAAHVTGIDFSATSVRCTEELKRKHKLKNLEVYQLPIERASDLAATFDQIVCTGVLHHLADPDAGLRALRSVLKPGGAMHLMVYAPYGRAGIYMLQEFCRRIGIHATDEEIPMLLGALTALPPAHPVENLLLEAPDFRYDAALADALLHPQDRSYSVPQLFSFIEKAGLTFGRWIRQAPYTPPCGAIAKLPRACRMTQLSPADQYAAVELFRGTMTCHSFVAYRNDGAGDPQQVSFGGDAWLGFVPIRTPDTICVHWGLPAGAVGVLINRTHTCRDLLMPIDATEKRWFDAIDGNRSIGDIVEASWPSLRETSPPEKASSFFKRLWHYDQAVFDMSRLSQRATEA
jgi:SAM-dependent methyltransferase